ncbi:YDG domain-containing protein, partial [Sphingomonas sp. YR710]|uniref:two-partner secretion domain-containing protein n=1 Tax=Sphingomonas sp. YR710 TaxID=1882773 RepID=UPI000B8109B6
MPTVTRGVATIATAGNITVVTQSSDKAVLNWSSLSVAGGTTLRFDQPGANAVTLNRVTGGGASRIDGTVSANGQVWLLNSSGILIGATGRVSAAGFLATTRDIADDDFMAGRYVFGGHGGGEIRNAGAIVAENGYAVLAGGKVSNSGLVSARLGTVVMAAGEGFSLDFAGDKLLSFAISEPLSAMSADGAISNSGTLTANGGRVILSARAAADAAASVINNAGLVQAQSVQLRNGEITLDAGPDGSMRIGGNLDASGRVAGETGGTIGLFGRSILVDDGAGLDADGDLGGGNIHVGGGYRGASIDGRPSALVVTVSHGASLSASALSRGDGGTISLWSDVSNPLSVTRAYGSFTANGGASSGNGGKIETSGHLLLTQGVRGSASAPAGMAGEWLFDPYDVHIVDQITTPDSTEILASDIVTVLSSGTDVTIDTANAPSQGASNMADGNITVSTAITKSGDGAATLTLRAHNDIIIEPGANITSTAGAFSVVLTADSDNDGMGLIKLGADIGASGGEVNGLQGIKYEGYFNENFDFFKTASVQQDSRFTNLFTAINTTTPGQNFDDTYSVRFFGFFKPDVSGVYTFRTGSDDSSYLWVGNAGESVPSLEGRISSISPTAAVPGLHGISYNSGTTTLTAGVLYPILVYFGENGGGDAIIVDFASPGGGLTNNGTGHYFTSLGGQVTLNGNVQLTGNATISAPGNVAFNGKLDGPAYGLTVQAASGSVKFADAIGSINPLANLTIDAGDVSAGSIALASGGNLALAVARNSDITGAITANHFTASGAGDINWIATSDADIAVNDIGLNGGTLRFKSASALTVSAPILLTAASIIAFDNPFGVTLSAAIDGHYDLDLGGNGPLTIGGVIGGSDRLANLHIHADGVLTIGADAQIRTDGNIRIAAAGGFVNNSLDADVLNSSSGNWLVWSGNNEPFDGGTPDSRGNLIHDFKAYGVSRADFDAIDSSAPFPVQGNGFVYAISPTVTVSVSRDYDGTTSATGPNIQLTGSGTVDGDAITGGTVAYGYFDSANAGARTATLNGIRLTAEDRSGKPVYGYTPDSGEVSGTITPKQLTASLTGAVSRAYNGTTAATLASSNYQISGLVDGETITATQTSGTFASANAGSGITITASLASSDLSAGSNTLLANYVLPTSAAGAIGEITRKQLTASLTGAVSRTYDGTTAATLAAS